jgi:phosphoheptose isomerase
MTATTARQFLNERQSLRPATTVKRERDMLARQLADVSRKNAELTILLAKAITVCGRHKEHDDCRHLAAELAGKIEALR